MDSEYTPYQNRAVARFGHPFTLPVYPYFFVCGGGGLASFKVVVAKAKGIVLLKQLYSLIWSVWWLVGRLVVLCGGGWLFTALWSGGLLVVVRAIGLWVVVVGY
jgi:hypothetical protein